MCIYDATMAMADLAALGAQDPQSTWIVHFPSIFNAGFAELAQVDLPHADVERVKSQLGSLFDCKPEEVLMVRVD
jgi:hypothetical protein